MASLATVLEGMKVNERKGDRLRLELHRMTLRVLDALDLLGIRTLNTSGYPIIEIPLIDADEIGRLGCSLFERGIYVSLAARPLVPRDEVGPRIQITAAKTDAQISHLIATLGALADSFRLRDEDASPVARAA